MQDAFYDEFGIGDSGSRLARIRGASLKWGAVALSLMVLGLLIFWGYRLGTRDPREIPVIRAMDVPMRVQPEDPGGTQMANQGLEVNEILAGNEAQTPEEVVLAPAAETPPVNETLSEAERLRKLILQPETRQADAAPAQAPEAVPLDIAAEADEGTDDMTDGLAESDGTAEDPADLVASLVEQVAAERSAGDRILRPVVRPRDFGGAPVRVAAQPDAAAQDPGETDATPDLASGTRLVQLGAFESEPQAAGQWYRLQRAHEDLLGGRETFIQRAESNGRVFYRLRVLGFDAQEDQRAMCDALQARDVECIPVTVR